MAKTAACFRGDAPHLVDALIAASAARASPAAGYGRELVAWVDADVAAPSSALFEPLELSSRGHVHHHNSKHGRSPDANKSKAAAAKRARASPTVSPARRCSLEHASRGAFACPSFAAAPKPEALPMPTSLLFRRSPSPPKMPAIQAVMA
ncbi:hypothetical protein Rsub_11390 [Raphidocelis subcapitata]|uniref:Uncharacterized protein n=1 Tax=Raphidocelis subcapitata TaxID=307507 RepID=A0A2V0PG30_9CHLO|nr:hypothetical protein Rsub_11390 [Raphidocelis subcapitata]|eukprot:GBF98808.1 hypothetical protein Rsub_11390 [Raphidocelis subcapitata]